jgi:5S rRNA maturation endonuclease (ribonuclease M5)
MGISISPDGVSLVNCLSCKFGGTFLYTVSKVAKERGLDYSKLTSKIALIEKQDPESLLAQVPPYFGFSVPAEDIVIDEEEIASMMGLAHPYVLRRGIGLETLKVWGGGFDSRMKRAIFPVRNSDGQLVGVVGRTVNNHPIRYFNYFDFNKSRFLFGEHLVKGGSIIVVEGLLDTVAVWQALQKEGVLDEYSVVGLLGSNPSKMQVEKIKKLATDAVLFLDNDEAGNAGTRTLTKYLRKSLLLTAIEYPSEKVLDPDDAVRQGYRISDLARNASLAAL